MKFIETLKVLKMPQNGLLNGPDGLPNTADDIETGEAGFPAGTGTPVKKYGSIDAEIQGIEVEIDWLAWRIQVGIYYCLFTAMQYEERTKLKVEIYPVYQLQDLVLDLR